MQESINRSLVTELSRYFPSPEAGVQAARKVLLRYGIDMPAIYGLDPEGDEIVLELNLISDGEEIEENKLYVIYYLTDEDNYEFFAELMDDETIDAIASDEEEDEEEEK